MLRKIIKIDEERCNGCGLCAQACHEGAIGIVDGKAKLLFEHYCDGLGDCLPACPMEAISFEEREAPAYDEEAVKASQAKAAVSEVLPCGCPGTASKVIERNEKGASASPQAGAVESKLSQWPVQIKLVSPQAPYFHDAHLLVAADCAAYAYGNFHQDFIAGKTTIIGCPKLDAVDYTEKLSQIIAANDIQSITVTRMEVPCCGGIEAAVKNAVQQSDKSIPVEIVTISSDGRIL